MYRWLFSPWVPIKLWLRLLSSQTIQMNPPFLLRWLGRVQHQTCWLAQVHSILERHTLGCTMPNEITLSNIGQEELVIYNMGGVADPFLLSNMPTFPLTLQPEESYTVYVDFAPGMEGQFTDVFSVASNDPDDDGVTDFSGVGQYIASYEQMWDNPVDPPSDIIFSVDQSCSMNDDAALLASSFSTFISQLNNYSTDWQIMVANSDSGCSNSGILTRIRVVSKVRFKVLYSLVEVLIQRPC